MIHLLLFFSLIYSEHPEDKKKNDNFTKSHERKWSQTLKISFKLLNEQRRTKCLQTCKIDLISDSYVPLDCLFLVCYSWWVDLSHKGLISSDFLEVLLRVEACVYTPAGIGRNYFEKYHFFSF